MNKKAVLSLLLLFNLLLCLGAIQPADSGVIGKIHISPDGTIVPSEAPIARAGNTFTFTGDINNEIFVEYNNAVIDGDEHSLTGGGSGVALDLTCSNVTIQNLQISHWDAGILGVFNNNTVTQCSISYCENALKLYAQYYIITKNTLANNEEAIRVGASGHHFIAANNFDSNKIGLALYYPDNAIIQNRFAHSSQTAILLDNMGWSQSFYLNNFLDNVRDLTDYTYGNSIIRPVQNVIPAWDNGAKGNCWSNYTGTDTNGDGIGDTLMQIPTYRRENFLAFYSYIDHYPLMVPQNIDAPIPPIPAANKAPAYPITVPGNEPTALSFLRDVFQVDLDSYTSKQASLQTALDGSTITQTIEYRLTKDLHSAGATFSFTNTTLTSCDFYTGIDTPMFTNMPNSQYEAAKTVIQNYQNWTNDPEVTSMVEAINTLGSAENGTAVIGNITLSHNSPSTYKWSYNYNGVDYTSVTLEVDGVNQDVHNLRFSDDRTLQKIGDTEIAVTKQQAIAIASAYVRSDFVYSREFDNGTQIFVKDFGVVEENATAGLAVMERDSSTLYPYWEVHVPLDNVYPSYVVAVNVKIWADSGTVFWARTESSGFGLLNLPSDVLLPYFIFFLGVGVAFVVCLLAVLVFVLRKTENSNPKDKPKEPLANNSRMQKRFG